MPRATLLSAAMIAAVSLRLGAAGAASEEVPVPGGTSAMAASLGISPVPERARFVAEIARLTHQVAEGKRTTRARAASTLLAAGGAPGDARKTKTAWGPDESVPIPLTVDVWSKAVFRRRVAPAEIVAAIVADPRAAHLCYGLAGMDDETLQFMAEHSGLVTRLYERTAAEVAAFGSSLHVRGGRIDPPGGADAAAIWEGTVGEKLDRPESFITELLQADQGRLAYLYDTIAELDAPRARFALGLWMNDPAFRLKRFKALAAVNRTAIPQWQPSRLPFTRPLHDVASILARIAVEPDGSPSAPSQRAAWAWAMESGDVPSGAPPPTAVGDDAPIDAAWLAQITTSADTRDRADRVDQLAFAQRVFSGVDAASVSDALVAIRAFPRYRMLLLTLERMGVRQPAVYAAAARKAQTVTSLDNRRASLALAQFQGALVLLARMAGVHTIDAARAEALVTSLAAVPLNNDGRYGSAIAKWIDQELVRGVRVQAPAAARPEASSGEASPKLASDPGASGGGDLGGDDLETVVRFAVAGPPGRGGGSPALIPWEGQLYRLDLETSENRRLQRIREKQGGATIDAALAKGADGVLADALIAWSYAISIADTDSPVLLSGGAIARHDFGFAPGERSARGRIPWAMPRQEIAVGIPWHVTGSLLGLDVALSSLALRRVTTDRLIDAPTMSTNERDAFAAAVALLNPYELRDADRDAIVEAVSRGRARVASLAEDTGAAADMMTAVRMDGWRRRALAWTMAHEPQRIESMFSLTELLYLGRAPIRDLHAWGMAALGSTGCFCTRLAPPNQWRALLGRPQLGLMASTVPDLNLHVAMMLHELRLPAAIAKSVLTAAVQDFIDETRPTDFNDWLTLVRSAQAVPRERIEDYVAAVTAQGPLIQAADPR